MVWTLLYIYGIPCANGAALLNLKSDDHLRQLAARANERGYVSGYRGFEACVELAEEKAIPIGAMWIVVGRRAR